MKKLLPIILLSAFPVYAIASGESALTPSTATTVFVPAQMEPHASPSGEAGDPAKVTRTIQVFIDIGRRFNPDQFTVKAGETIRLSVKNGSTVPHEVVIGTMAELKAHGKLMRSMPEMDHGDSNMMKMAAGESASIAWHFETAGTVNFACLVPGHLETGMLGKIKIE